MGVSDGFRGGGWGDVTQSCDVTCVQSATQWTASVHTLHMPKPNVTRVQSATQWTASVHTLHMPKPNAGDNAAESEFARSKNQLRRIGKLGRMSPKTSHIDVLAVRRLLERPGLATCVAALARYRKSRAGQLGHAPGDAYDITKDHEWLFE